MAAIASTPVAATSSPSDMAPAQVNEDRTDQPSIEVKNHHRPAQPSTPPTSLQAPHDSAASASSSHSHAPTLRAFHSPPTSAPSTPQFSRQSNGSSVSDENASTPAASSVRHSDEAVALPLRPRTALPHTHSHPPPRTSSALSATPPAMTRAHSSPAVSTSSGRVHLSAGTSATYGPPSPLGSYRRYHSPSRRGTDESGVSFGGQSLTDIGEAAWEGAEADQATATGGPAILARSQQTPTAAAATPPPPLLSYQSHTFPRRHRPSSPLHQMLTPTTFQPARSGAAASAASAPTMASPLLSSSSSSSLSLSPASSSTAAATNLTPSPSSSSTSLAAKYNEAYPLHAAGPGFASYYAASVSSVPSTPTSARSRSPSLSSLETIPDSPDAEAAALEAERIARLKAAADAADAAAVAAATATTTANNNHGKSSTLLSPLVARRRSYLDVAQAGTHSNTLSSSSSSSSSMSSSSSSFSGRSLSGFGSVYGSRDKRKRWSVCGAERRGDLDLETIWED